MVSTSSTTRPAGDDVPRRANTRRLADRGTVEAGTVEFDGCSAIGPDDMERAPGPEDCAAGTAFSPTGSLHHVGVSLGFRHPLPGKLEGDAQAGLVVRQARRDPVQLR